VGQEEHWEGTAGGGGSDTSGLSGWRRLGRCDRYVRLESRKLQEAGEFLHIQSSVSNQLSEQTWLQGAVIWHRERLTGGIKWMPKANVTTALADHLVTKMLECPNCYLA
jgi:hypothetical protein